MGSNGKFFITISQGLILAGVASYIIENKNRISRIIAVLLGVVTLGYGLFLTATAALIKKDG